MKIEEMSRLHDEAVARAATEGCSEWVMRQRCGLPAVKGSERCAEHEAMVNAGYRPCFACGAKQSFVNDEPWAALEGRNADWWIVSVTPCCRKQSHTELLATFSGYLHDAKTNALNACRLHNEQIPLQRAKWEHLRSIPDLNERVQTAMDRKAATEAANEKCKLYPEGSRELTIKARGR